jgi:hypothetical protein
LSPVLRIHHTTARRHGVADADMLHAVRHRRARIDQPGGVAMLVGATPAGRFLEVGVLDIDGDDPVIIHAMPMRAKYQRFLDRR